jgi:N-acetylated-alpha-linked acidic dipeptidase
VPFLICDVPARRNFRAPSAATDITVIDDRRVTKEWNAISLLIFILTGSLSAQQPRQQAFLGFTAQSTKGESEWEDRFRAIPDPQLMRANMQLLSAHPHHVGSPYDKQNAEWILTQYKQWGWDAHIETFQVLFPTPKTRLLEMIAPTRFAAKLDEPALSTDPTSKQKNEQLPTYNAYSPDGDVTAPLVYVNYGERWLWRRNHRTAKLCSSHSTTMHH